VQPEQPLTRAAEKAAEAGIGVDAAALVVEDQDAFRQRLEEGAVPLFAEVVSSISHPQL
jgi:hypothetical protein